MSSAACVLPSAAFSKKPLALPLTSVKPELGRVERNRCGTEWSLSWEVGEQSCVEVAGVSRDEGRCLCGPVGAVLAV